MNFFVFKKLLRTQALTTLAAMLLITLASYVSTPDEPQIFSAEIEEEYEENPDWDVVWDAVYKRDADAMKRMMTACDLTRKNGYGRNSIIALACDYDNFEVVDAVLKRGIDPNERDTFENATLLHYAARSTKDIRILEAMLAHGADVNAQDERGRTPLMLALHPFEEEADTAAYVALLLRAGADVRLFTENGQDVMMMAAYNSSDKVLFLIFNALMQSAPELLQDPAYLALLAVRTKSDEFLSMLTALSKRMEKTPLPRRLHVMPHNTQAWLVYELLDAGVPVDTRDQRGRTLLTTLCENPDMLTMELLLAHGADVNAKSDSGWTPLMAASYDNANRDLLERLLRAGADVNAKDEHGCTALHYTIGHNYTNNILPAVITLLQAGADMNARTKKNETPLLLASHRNYDDNLAWLLFRMGADIHVRDDYGRTVIMESSGFLHELIDANADKILTQKERCKVVESAFYSGVDEARIWRLLRRGIDFQQTGVLESAAAYNASPELITFLLKRGAQLDPPDLTKRYSGAKSALGLSIENRNWQLVELLLKAGAKVRKDYLEQRQTLIALARINGALTPEIIARLHEAGEPIGDRYAIEYPTEKTALILAAEHYDNPQIITTLLNLGANPNARDAEGKTALDYLRENNKLNKTPALTALEKAMR